MPKEHQEKLAATGRLDKRPWLTEDAYGSLSLEVPFTDIRELSTVIFRKGRHVVALKLKELRD